LKASRLGENPEFDPSSSRLWNGIKKEKKTANGTGFRFNRSPEHRGDVSRLAVI
jgi:hypothetical protein